MNDATMNDDPIGKAARKTRRRHKVPEGTVCPLCTEQDPDCLIEVDKTIFEAHHIAGVANLPDDTVWVCCNCHRKLHIVLSDEGVNLVHPEKRMLLKVVQALLVGCAVFFRKLADTFLWLARLLGELIGSLDEELPSWRDLPEATL
jgi:hypothetical protein